MVSVHVPVETGLIMSLTKIIIEIVEEIDTTLEIIHCTGKELVARGDIALIEDKYLNFTIAKKKPFSVKLEGFLSVRPSRTCLTLKRKSSSGRLI